MLMQFQFAKDCFVELLMTSDIFIHSNGDCIVYCIISKHDLSDMMFFNMDAAVLNNY